MYRELSSKANKLNTIIHQSKILKIGDFKNSTTWWLGGLVGFMLLAVFQDYLFSKFQDTGFYLSESLLYNAIWLFLIPLTVLEFGLLDKIRVVTKLHKSFFIIGLSALLCLLHILLFSIFFVTVSHLIYTPGHAFRNIFGSAMSGQFYLLLLFYTATPFIRDFLNDRKEKEKQASVGLDDKIKIKTGVKTVVLNMEDIEWITTDKPYSVLHANGKVYLDDRSLKDFEDLLNPIQFLRVHRSSIIHVTFIKSFTSRQNGDYDVELKSGQMVRMSRHFKQNWDALLH